MEAGDLEAEVEIFAVVQSRPEAADILEDISLDDDAERIPEFVSRAFYTATAGRPPIR